MDIAHERTTIHASDYKAHFAWIDHIGEVRDRSLVGRLDDRLIDMLRAWTDGTGDKVWLVAPDVIDWSEAGQFTYDDEYESPESDLHVRDFLGTVTSRNGISLPYLKQRRIVLWNADGETKRATWSAYNCLYAEIDQDGDTHLLTAGRWYRVEKSFAEVVKDDVHSLVASSPALPPYTSADASETAYNGRVAKTMPQYALLDRESIMYGGGRSRFEVCDLLSKSGEMIHVKRYGGSAPLSHLFAQGANSAQLWMSEVEFRKSVAKVLPRSHALALPDKRPASDQYSLVYAIVSQSKKPIDESLPFFSCLTLRNAARAIRSVGMGVSLVKVQRQ